MPKYLSGRSKLTSKYTDDRRKYLNLNQAEPSLAIPLSPIGDEENLPTGDLMQIVSVYGDSNPTNRYWVPFGGGLIPGAITVFEEGTIVGGPSSTTQLDFRGNIVTAIGDNTGLPDPGVAVTVTLAPVGNNHELMFNDDGEFGATSFFVYDNSTVGIASVGIGTSTPSTNLHIVGSTRIEETIYDYNNDPGSVSNILTKGAFGIEWAEAGAVQSGAGGTFYEVQYHGTVGLVDGAPNFVWRNDKVGIGSTLPTRTLDVFGNTRFTGVNTFSQLNPDLLYAGISTFINNVKFDGATEGKDLLWDRSSSILELQDYVTLGIGTGSDLKLYHEGGAHASEEVSFIDAGTAYPLHILADTFITKNAGSSQTTIAAFNNGVVELFYAGAKKLSTINNGVKVFGTLISEVFEADDFTAVDIDISDTATTNSLISTYSVLGFGTATQFNVTGVITSTDLYVTGVGTIGEFYADNVKIDGNAITTKTGNLNISADGTSTIDINNITVIDNTEDSSWAVDTGALQVKGGASVTNKLFVGQDLTVSGVTTLASAGGTTTAKGDLYVTGDIYVTGDMTYDELSGRTINAEESITTKQFKATGVSTVGIFTATEVGIAGSISVAGLSTFIGISTFQNDVFFLGKSSSQYMAWDQDESHLNFGPNAKIIFNKADTGGGKPGLEIYHNGNDSIIHENGLGGLHIKTGTLIKLITDGDNDMLVAAPGAGVTLSYNGNKRFETTGLGITVTGLTSTTDLYVTGLSTFMGISSFFGDVYFTGEVIGQNFTYNDGSFVSLTVTGETNLEGDITILGSDDTSTKLQWDQSNNNLRYYDGVRAEFGADADLYITANGTTNQIALDHNITAEGKLEVISDYLELKSSSASNKPYLQSSVGAGVTLFYDNNKRLETSGIGITVTGVTSTTDLYVTGISTFVGLTTVGVLTAYDDVSILKGLKDKDGEFGDALQVLQATGDTEGKVQWSNVSDLAVDNATNAAKIGIGTNDILLQTFYPVFVGTNHPSSTRDNELPYTHEKFVFKDGGSHKARLGINIDPDESISVGGTIKARNSDDTKHVMLTDNGGIEILRKYTTTDPVGGGPYIDFKSEKSDNYDARIQLYQEVGSGHTGGLKFETGGNSSIKTSMVIDSSGSIGIGTTMPESGLDLYKYDGIGGTRQYDWTNNGIIGGSHVDMAVTRRHGSTKKNATGNQLGYTGPIIEFRSANGNEEWTTAQIMSVVDADGGSNYSGGLLFLTTPSNPEGGVDPVGRRTKGLPPQGRLLLGPTGNVLPVVTTTQNLGSTNNRWNIVYAKTLNLSGGQIEAPDQEVGFLRVSGIATVYKEKDDAYTGITSERGEQYLDIENTSGVTSSFSSVHFLNGADSDSHGDISFNGIKGSSPFKSSFSIKQRTGKEVWGEIVRIGENGHVGIGTNSPKSLLHLQTKRQNSDPALSRLLTLATSRPDSPTPQSTGMEIKFYNEDQNNNTEGYFTANIPYKYGTNETKREKTLDFNFKQKDNGTLYTTFTIKGEKGRVGIGSTLPQTSLNIRSADPAIRFTDTDSDAIYSQIDGTGGNLILSVDGGNEDEGTVADSFISFRIDGTVDDAEKVRIDKDGNVLPFDYTLDIDPSPTQDLGSTTIKWDNVYAETIHGQLGDTITSLTVDDLTVNNTTILGNEATDTVTIVGDTGITGSLEVDNLNIDGNTIASLDSEDENVDIKLSPKGDGAVNVTTTLDVDGTGSSTFDGPLEIGNNTNNGNSTIKGTGRDILSIQTTDNSKDRGIVFENSADGKYVGWIGITGMDATGGDMIFGLRDGQTDTLTDINTRLRINKNGNVVIGYDGDATNAAALTGNTAILTVGEIKANNINLTGTASFIDSQKGEFEWLNVTGMTTTTGLRSTGISTFTAKTFIEGSNVLNFGNTEEHEDEGHLRIHYDGSSAGMVDMYEKDASLYIRTNTKEVGSGSIYIRAFGDTSKSEGKNSIIVEGGSGTTGGSVSLYHQGTERLKTSSTGIDVTGNLNLSSSNARGSIISNGGSGKDFQLYNDETLGKISLIVENLDGTKVTALKIEAPYDADSEKIKSKITATGNILPATTDTYNLGESATNRWATVYAETFNGAFQGTANDAKWAEFAKKVDTVARSGNENTHYLTFVDSNNSGENNIDDDSDANAELVYTDNKLQWKPSTNTLTISDTSETGDKGKIKVDQILDSGGNAGTKGQILAKTNDDNNVLEWRNDNTGSDTKYSFNLIETKSEGVITKVQLKLDGTDSTDDDDYVDFYPGDNVYFSDFDSGDNGKFTINATDTQGPNDNTTYKILAKQDNVIPVNNDNPKIALEGSNDGTSFSEVSKVTLHGVDPIDITYESAEKIKISLKDGTNLGAANFLDLEDTPDDYDEKGGYYVRVNSNANALEFTSVSAAEATGKSDSVKVTKKGASSTDWGWYPITFGMNITDESGSATDYWSLHRDDDTRYGWSYPSTYLSFNPRLDQFMTVRARSYQLVTWFGEGETNDNPKYYGDKGEAGQVATSAGPEYGWYWSNPSSLATVSINHDGYGCNKQNDIDGAKLIGATKGTITITSLSNAYGRRYVQTSEPTSGLCVGDIWYDTSEGTGSGDGFESGTVIVFHQSSAPTGWSKVSTLSSQNINNRALRVVTGSVSRSTSGNSFTSALRGNTSTSGGNVQGHAIDIDEMPSHTHAYTDPMIGGYKGLEHDDTGDAAEWPWENAGTTVARGGGQSHDHGFTNPTVNLNVHYVDVILAEKD